MGRYGKKVSAPKNGPEPRICWGCESVCILKCTGSCSSSCIGTLNLKPAAEKNKN